MGMSKDPASGRRIPPPRTPRAVPLHVVRDEYAISTDQRYLDVALIHRFLSERSYWAEGIPLDVVRRSLDGSLNFGLYEGDPLVGTSKQIGFARVVTDGATFGWLCDVFVLEDHRGKGLGKWLVDTVLEHPALVGLRRIVLGTRDAQGLYARSGFKAVPEGRMMVLRVRDRAVPAEGDPEKEDASGSPPGR
jgi:GNAT superfamily N-acetyltransferase